MRILEGLCPDRSWLVFMHPMGAEELRSEMLSGELVPRQVCCLQNLVEIGRDLGTPDQVS